MIRSCTRVAILKSWRTAVSTILLVLLLTISAPGSALADTNTNQQNALSELEDALARSPALDRQADLNRLKEAIEASSDRAQISNESSHQVGLFARYKKSDPQQAAAFYVLAPGHQTDDDFEAVALLIPPAVALDWTTNRVPADTSAARLLTILPASSSLSAIPTLGRVKRPNPQPNQPRAPPANPMARHLRLPAPKPPANPVQRSTTSR